MPPGLARPAPPATPRASARSRSHPAGVHDVHPELILGRGLVTDSLQPRRGTSGPPGRVDNEIGGEDLRPIAARARQHASTSDPVPGRRGDQALALPRTGPGSRRWAGPEPGRGHGLPARRARHLDGSPRPPSWHSGRPPKTNRNSREHAAPGPRPTTRSASSPGNSSPRICAPLGSSPWAVPALRNPLAVQPGLRQRVPFDDRHPPVRISQHPGREQAAHTGTQNRRVITNLLHFVPPPVSRPNSGRLTCVPTPAPRPRQPPAQRRLRRHGARRRPADTPAARRTCQQRSGDRALQRRSFIPS